MTTGLPSLHSPHAEKHDLLKLAVPCPRPATSWGPIIPLLYPPLGEKTGTGQQLVGDNTTP